MNPNNLGARRELQSEMENFVFPRFSWLSPEEIVKQVAIDTVASLRAIEKKQEVVWEEDNKENFLYTNLHTVICTSNKQKNYE